MAPYMGSLTGRMRPGIGIAGAAGVLGGGRDPLLDNLVAYWSNNDLTGADQTGVSNLAKVGTGSSLISGKVYPNAIALPGTGTADRFWRASNPRLAISANGFTIAAWLNWISLGASNQGAISKFGNEYYLYRTGGANMTWLVQKTDGANVMADGGAPAVDTWKLYVVGYDPGAGKIFAYADNTLIAAPNCATPRIGGTSDFSFPRSGSNSDVRIGPVAIWHKSLYQQTDLLDRLWNGGMGLGHPFYTPSHVLVFDGDSLTWGGGEAQYPRPYPYQTITSLGGFYDWHNTGVAGRSFQQIIDAAPAAVDSKLVAGKKNICIIAGGTNDLYPNGTSKTAVDVENYYQTYVSARKAAGWDKVLVTTMTAGDPATVDPDFETERQALNTWLRANYASFADGLVDPGGDAIIGDVANCGNTDYFTDRLHLTTAGYAIWAGLAKTALLGV
jgi:lysophospholipase L1-like esterase